MKRERVKWVEFWAPGLVIGESWVKKVDTTFQPSDVSWPTGAYAFIIHEQIDIIEEDKRYKGKSEQVGLMYYHPKSKIETLAEVKSHIDGNEILIRNMEMNGFDKIIWTRWGNWPQPYDEKKIVILDKTKS